MPDPTPHGACLDDVAQAAARAFDLLPAEPGRSGDAPPVDTVPGDARHGDARDGDGGLAQRLRTDPDTVERDLARLVLTLVELLRQLMERAALHRVDQGDLTEEQEERIGVTLMTLQDKMSDLCDRHGLSPEDLNLDLGPLGSLLPRT